MASRGARHPRALHGDAALNATADYLFKGLFASSLLKKHVSESISAAFKEALRRFLSDAFDGAFPDIRIGRDLLLDSTFRGFQEVLLAAIEQNGMDGSDTLVQAVASVLPAFKDDPRVKALVSEIEDAAGCGASGSEQVVEEADEDEERVQFATTSFASMEGSDERFEVDADEVVIDSLVPLVLLEAQIVEIHECWQGFLDCHAKPEHAGEAIFAAILDAAPSLQTIFRAGTALVAGKFVAGYSQMVQSLRSPNQLMGVVEHMGFQHLEVDINIPRIAIFREALCDVVGSELGERLTDLGAHGLRRLVSYAGGALIYIRENYSKRLKIISNSWQLARAPAGQDEAHKVEDVEDSLAAPLETKKQLEEEEEDDEEEGELGVAGKSQAAASTPSKKRGFFASLCGAKVSTKMHTENAGAAQKLQDNLQAVPRSFEDMFRFNMAVMNVQQHVWMYEVLDCFDAIVQTISQSQRLQVECDIVTLRIARVGGDVKFRNFKAVMLSSLRALAPKGWNPDHEVAWNWLWETVERLLSKELKKPRARERILGRFLGSLEDELRQEIREKVFDRFFELAPGGEEHFKQSATRLNFIADKAIDLTLQLYKDPINTVDAISALGLRHVGYGVTADFFDPFVEGWTQVFQELTGDDDVADAFRWSFSLVAKLLVRTIEQGATLVMKAINTNNAKQVRRALSYAPRGIRATWVLDVTVGTQSVSPLYMSIDTGNLEAAKVMLKDLVTIRADRARYYYGLDDLFKWHPDIVKKLTADAPELLMTMLDGMVWRSRVVVNGNRRVNYYLKHLLVDEFGKFSNAMSCIVKLGDPHIADHPILVELGDLVWNDLVYWRFLRGKASLVCTAVIIMLSQSVLQYIDTAGSFEERVATFCCRLVIYLYFMVSLIYFRTKHVYQAVKHEELLIFGGMKMPRKWIDDWQEGVSLALTISLVVMFFLEPILACLQHTEGLGIFTQNCSQANDARGLYEILSMIAIMLIFALAADAATVSTRLSSWLLVAGHVLPDLGRALLACGFLVLTFGSSVAACVGQPEDFQGIGNSVMSFLQLAVNMFPASHLEQLEDNIMLFAAASCFRVLVVFLLMNVLIAQLTCCYKQISVSMVGYARLRRMHKVCEAMEVIPSGSFQGFILNLRLDDPVEFGEGDVGPAGGIQVLEPGNLHPTNVDTIRRLGGNPKNPFPPEDEELTEADRCQRLFKMYQKTVKKITQGGASSDDKPARAATSRTTFGSMPTEAK
ncbi:unnamed protein product [Symbiodinium natans]|uniref:Globin domain-containing protein n=1 Tax=Symbiodinium natans TaxID=878477 RepID=A0A812T9K8_9DINO|nr:unnamed protein product [Symbiodinium natans]